MSILERLDFWLSLIVGSVVGYHLLTQRAPVVLDRVEARLSSVLAWFRPAPAPTVCADDAVAVMSRHDGRDLAERYRRFVIRAQKREKAETEKLKLENQRLQNQLRDITEGQRRGIREYLERKAAKRDMSDTVVTLLLGKDKTAGLREIREIERQIEAEKIAATPVPPETANMVPLPEWAAQSRF